ncbi:hypothetical protein H2198_004373 [Neophaeococcomyces mojaviensis]|uniref:Uncharacterized protein n=1 Tax=Neophaeococcomyces mojaviensis TaxID=3383035 RepID=A0ACC3A8R0_9EURO|nr:hypothetical protein H2198_004373 [Knufia sp. JES_112]
MTDAATKLREKQKPLKDRYRSDPSSALVTLSSTSTLDAGLSCSLATASAAKKVAGLHQAAGGAGFDMSGELCSGDMLLESLVACFGVTVKAVSTAMGIPLEGGSITAQGDLDFRGTLGIKGKDGEAVPVGFKSIRLVVGLKVDEEHKGSVDKLIQLSERYCVVLQTIKQGVNVETQVDDVSKPVSDVKKDGHATENANGGEPEPTVADDEVIPLQ